MRQTIKQLNIASYGHSNIHKLSEGSGGSLIKRALLVFEGTHNGMYGKVTLSREFLTVMVERFNREYANPMNENDFPPVSKDHDTCADNTLGRIIGPLEAVDFKHPRTGLEVLGVFGDIRIDDSDAIKNVNSGKYSHLSISFDDDADNLGELYEVSFVGVEAARGSQVLSKGDKMNIEQKFESLNAKYLGLKKLSKSKSLAIKAGVKSLKANLDGIQTDAEKLASGVKEGVKEIKLGLLKAKFKDFVREGRLSKAELDGIKFEDLVDMDQKSLSIVLTSYKSRPVSSDVAQFGIKGAEPRSKELTTAEIRRLRAEQRAGKTGSSLSLEDEEKAEELSGDVAGQTDETREVSGTSIEEVEEALKKLEGFGELRDRLEEATKRMEETLSKLMADSEGNDNSDDEEGDE